ncbi:MAG: ArsR/SmtB family transcription factor [Methanoculleaceae archaeon]
MLEAAEVSRLLDILGNRNRRRIIQLLQQKPCFVTEISERLMISPKAVIEHLQMMERENLLQSYCDSRRRKYYTLSRDINLMIKLERMNRVIPVNPQLEDSRHRFLRDLVMLREMVRIRDDLASDLERLEHEIDERINSLAREGRSMLRDDRDVNLLLAIAQYSLTMEELEEISGLPRSEVAASLGRLEDEGLIEQKESVYSLRGVHVK